MHGMISIFFVVRKVLIVRLVTGQLGHPVSGHRLLAAARLVLPLPLALLRSLLELADLGLPRLLRLILELQLRPRLRSEGVLPVIGHLPAQLHQL